MELDAHIQATVTHRLRFTQDVLAPSNPTLCDVIRADADGRLARILPFVDSGVLAAWPDLPEDLLAYAAAHSDVLECVGPMHVVPGAEGCKNDRAVLDDVLQAIHGARLCRQSYVVVIGGGAVLDVVGFAAATSHRGVRLVRLPTTTLAQADSGIGVKNGINLFGKKNYLGTFDVPSAVLNDPRFLATLSDRDWIAGFSEAVKVALIKDRSLFDDIARDSARIAARDSAVAEPIIQRSCKLHFEHIALGGDPFERHAARPLDFGHWAAHKLEQMSRFELNHGEAVAIGVALDVTYSALAGRLDWAEAEQVHTCLTRLGFDLYHPLMQNHGTLLEGLDEFREHLGGELTIPVLERIGRSTVVHEIDRARVTASIERLASCNGHLRC